MEHFVTEGARTKVVSTRPFKSEIEGADLFAIDKNVMSVKVPFVWPKKVAPARIGAFDDKVDIIDIAIVVTVEDVVGRYWGGVVDVVDGTDEQLEFTVSAFAIIGVTDRIVVVVWHEIATRMWRLVREDCVAVGSGCVVGTDKKLVI